ncbi:MlaD family protein [Caenispirillum salinarum]|uniref:MlaD family protein n=1 Tax=Caenispirillum salinarum TaxID=859058 RepID=UPI0038512E6C
MESKAHPLLVGIFTVVFILGMLAFVAWLVNLGLGDDRTRYQVMFEQSVAGIDEGTSVRVKGIDVGKVERLRLGVENPTRVPVVIGVRSDLPISQDAYVTVESMGITGATYLALHPGEAGGPQLTAPEGQQMATIGTRPSGGLSAIMDTLPKVASDLRAAVDRVADVLDEERMAQVDRILNNIAETTEAAPGIMREARLALRDAQGALVTGEKAAAEARETFRSADALIDGEISETVAEARGAASSLRAAANRLERTLRQAGPGVGEFASEGLTEIRYLVSESRRMVDELTQLADRLQDNPNALVFGEEPSTFDPEVQ